MLRACPLSTRQRAPSPSRHLACRTTRMTTSRAAQRPVARVDAARPGTTGQAARGCGEASQVAPARASEGGLIQAGAR
eukprot:1583219-Prymnesium_polylepis.1